MDIRESFQDLEEIVRTTVGSILKDIWTAMPVQVTENTKDGHTATVQPTIKRSKIDPQTGDVTYHDHPLHVDAPIHHLTGGGVTHTFPNKQGDTGTVIYASRPIDTWFQSGGTQQPIDDRIHSLGDALYLSGIRATPQKLLQVAPDSTQIRSDDKLHVIDHHPQQGTHVKSADPSTAPASESFDPFTQATKFIEHMVQGASGLIANATNGGTTHSHGVDYDTGAFMRALNGLHQVLAHPDIGAMLSAASGAHIVQADPSAGVVITSAKTVAISASKAISLSAPSLSLPSGSVPSASLAVNAASDNVGALGGDLSGTLPNPNVVGILHVTGANALGNYANDAAAAAGGVAIGQLYRNGSVLQVRVA